jgi:hypothetical protein
MKRFILPLVFLATVLAVPATAAAFGGVVVAKNSARHTLVVASRGGVVRTVRAGTRFGSVQIGRRVSYAASRLSDGTFKARTIRTGARVRRAFLRGVVVRQRGSNTLLSAGGSLVFVRVAAPRAALATARQRPGDIVTASVRINGSRLTARSLRTVGHTNTVELEGIFLGIAGNQLRLAIEHRGEVFVTVPDGFQLPQLNPGDEIEATVSVDGTGAFTLVSIRVEDDDDQGEQGRVKVKGAITAIDDTRVTVQGHDDGSRQGDDGDSPVSCFVPNGFNLAGFKVGDRVEMRCALVNDKLTLTRLRHEDEGGGDG